MRRLFAPRSLCTAAISRGIRGYEVLQTTNWCGNVQFDAAEVHAPSSSFELERLIGCAESSVHVVGRGHSFSPMAECSGGTLLSLHRLNRILDFKEPSSANGGVGSITVEGGTTYTEIARFLAGRGALRNLPSCPQFTVAGAIATGTHGSGVHARNLAADSISMLEFVAGDGSLVRYSRDGSADLLEGCRTHLGVLGVVSQLTLDVVPFFEVDARTYVDVPLEPVVERLPDLWRSCDSLSVWTAGLGTGPGSGLCWITLRHFHPHFEPSIAAPPAAPVDAGMLGSQGFLMERPVPRYCSDDGSLFTPTRRGPWHSTLSLTLNDDCEETSMAVVDIQAEFFVPIEHAQEAIRAVWDVARLWSFSSPWGRQESQPAKGLIDAMEFRQVKGDGAWLSPQPVDSLGLHISFNADPTLRVEVLGTALPAIEAALARFGARAHWGKLGDATFEPSRVEELYGERLQRFRTLARNHDPQGRFLNEHMRRVLRL